MRGTVVRYGQHKDYTHGGVDVRHCHWRLTPQKEQQMQNAASPHALLSDELATLAGFAVGSRVKFNITVDQGDYLTIMSGEQGAVVTSTPGGDFGPAFVAVLLDTPHWQLGPSNLLNVSEDCDDILQSMVTASYGTSDTVVSFPTGRQSPEGL